MAVLSARRLHHETSAILDAVASGKTFQIVRNGKLIGTLRPAKVSFVKEWKEIMAEVWAVQKVARGTTANPVLVERGRRRR